MDHQGIIAVDIASYGNYGWATTVPVKTIADAKKVKFRIAEAAVNQLSYQAWGFNPVVMPWPDVPVALKQGVITGLDHTLTVCSITKKFEVAKYFTEINYAQGLFIWLFNKAWFKSLPSDLQKTLIETVKDMCAEARVAAEKQEMEQVEVARTNFGVEFFSLSDKEMNTLKKQAISVHEEFAPEINRLYEGDVYRPENYLSEVQDYMGFK
jgi:TRAP-type C4-dicarboxylate transport system substrate-binding protein